jgi:hypothetical protein
LGPDVAGEQKLYRMPLDGSSLVPIATFEHNEVVAVAADANYVYVGLNQGGIARVAK